MKHRKFKAKKYSSFAEAIRDTNSRLFEVVFTKANGEERKMLAKIGVKKYLSKNPNKRKTKKSSEVISVFDMEVKQYRSFRIDSIKEFKCGEVILK